MFILFWYFLETNVFCNGTRRNCFVLLDMTTAVVCAVWPKGWQQHNCVRLIMFSLGTPFRSEVIGIFVDPHRQNVVLEQRGQPTHLLVPYNHICQTSYKMTYTVQICRWWEPSQLWWRQSTYRNRAALTTNDLRTDLLAQFVFQILSIGHAQKVFEKSGHKNWISHCSKIDYFHKRPCWRISWIIEKLWSLHPTRTRSVLSLMFVFHLPSWSHGGLRLTVLLFKVIGLI